MATLQESGSMNASYDRIGINYADLRKPDPRIEAVIQRRWDRRGPS
jgi:hypothetical protein